jgi:hypothetical protein
MIAYKKGKVISKFVNKVKLASSITAKEPSIGGDTGGFGCSPEHSIIPTGIRQ